MVPVVSCADANDAVHKTVMKATRKTRRRVFEPFLLPITEPSVQSTTQARYANQRSLSRHRSLKSGNLHRRAAARAKKNRRNKRKEKTIYLLPLLLFSCWILGVFSVIPVSPSLKVRCHRSAREGPRFLGTVRPPHNDPLDRASRLRGRNADADRSANSSCRRRALPATARRRRPRSRTRAPIALRFDGVPDQLQRRASGASAGPIEPEQIGRVVDVVDDDVDVAVVVEVGERGAARRPSAS